MSGFAIRRDGRNRVLWTDTLLWHIQMRRRQRATLRTIAAELGIPYSSLKAGLKRQRMALPAAAEQVAETRMTARQAREQAECDRQEAEADEDDSLPFHSPPRPPDPRDHACGCGYRKRCEEGNDLFAAVCRQPWGCAEREQARQAYFVHTSRGRD